MITPTVGWARRNRPLRARRRPHDHLGPIFTETPAGAFCLTSDAKELASQRCPLVQCEDQSSTCSQASRCARRCALETRARLQLQLCCSPLRLCRASMHASQLCAAAGGAGLRWREIGAALGCMSHATVPRTRAADRAAACPAAAMEPAERPSRAVCVLACDVAPGGSKKIM